MEQMELLHDTISAVVYGKKNISRTTPLFKSINKYYKKVISEIDTDVKGMENFLKLCLVAERNKCDYLHRTEANKQIDIVYNELTTRIDTNIKAISEGNDE